MFLILTTDADNTIILLQFATSLGAEDGELRQHLNIGELNSRI
jgi:hypothetical protein